MNNQTATIIGIVGSVVAVISTFLVRAEISIGGFSESVNLIDEGVGKIILVLGLAGIVMGVLTIQGKASLRTAMISVAGVTLALAIIALMSASSDVSDLNDLAGEDVASLGLANWASLLGAIGMLAGGIMSSKSGAAAE